VVVNSPNGGEIIEAGSAFSITWSPKSVAGVEITSQVIRLSTDGGATFPTIVATGLAGDVLVFNWPVPADLKTTQGRIRLTVTDSAGLSVSDDSNANFVLLQGVSKVSRQYVYDELSRLTQILFEDGSTIAYTYDAVGNRIKTGPEYSGDFDEDGDVDGSDLAALIANPSLIDLATFAKNFGKTVSP
jgi:YD repeat-containing protein